MQKYTITFVKENGYKNYYQTVVEAEDGKQAFLKARNEAESKGIKLPNEVWTRTHQHNEPQSLMTYDEALKHILASKLTHKNAGNDSWYAYQYFAKRIHFCDENGKDMIWVTFNKLDLTEWYPYKKPFDFEAIQDKLVNLNESQRWEVENFIDSLLTTSPKTQ